MQSILLRMRTVRCLQGAVRCGMPGDQEETVQSLARGSTGASCQVSAAQHASTTTVIKLLSELWLEMMLTVQRQNHAIHAYLLGVNRDRNFVLLGVHFACAQLQFIDSDNSQHTTKCVLNLLLQAQDWVF